MVAQIFISYARDDDLPPPGRDDLRGFVAYLDEQLRYELTLLGEPCPKLWRDKRNIQRGEQFDPIISQAISESDLFIVVLSRNWLTRPWCQRELELFSRRWGNQSEAQNRIIIVGRNRVLPEQIPAVLEGQEGYLFYDHERGTQPGQEQEFFVRSRVVDPRYEARLAELARYIWMAAIRTKTPDLRPSAVLAVSRPPPADLQNRTVYVAKPAGDMRMAYDRLVRELMSNGYTVVPTLDAEIPNDEAIGFIDLALVAAEVSVHAIGERPGFAPERAAPIMQLQLQRAAERAKSKSEFRRILWIPKFLIEAEDSASERDPFEVLGRFDRQLETDTIVSDTLSPFIEYLTQDLRQGKLIPEEIRTLDEGALVYVYYHEEDEDYAIDVAKALRQHRLRPVLPAFEGDPIAIERFHRERLRDSQAVVLCWARAPEIWAKATYFEWASWEKLGRPERFSVRGLIAGPPPNGRKSVLIRLPPEDELDVILDLTGIEKPEPIHLNPIVRAAGSSNVG